jgi:hypothetical protein
LVLPEQKEIPVEVLEKIKDLVHAGATIIGPKPEMSTGLYQFEKTDSQVKKIADELWGKENTGVVDNQYGKGRVVYGKSIRDVLSGKHILPDMEYISCRDSSSIDFIHRKDGNAEIYYLANLVEQADYLNVTFRVTGKIPQIWNPADGSVVDQPVYTDDGERISMPLYFDPFGSMFIVFREKEESTHIVSVSKSGENIFPQLPRQLPEEPYYVFSPDAKWTFYTAGSYELKDNTGQVKNIDIAPVRSLEITPPWKVAFSKEWGGPEEIVFDRLISWPESEIPGIKYYSGTASYTNHFTIDKSMIAGHSICLDLGTMFNITEVIINGQSLGTCWKKPFRKDITPAIVSGNNTLELKVTNLWPNRLIGDQSLPEEKRFTETNITDMSRGGRKYFEKDDPLKPSGLIGPVKVIVIQNEK